MPRKRDRSHAYDFRPADTLRSIERSHQGTSGAGEPCARGEWCFGAKVERRGDGPAVRIPARSPRPFCEACRGRLGICLEELPAAYARMAAEIGEAVRRSEMVRTPFGPSLPLRENVDAAMRLTGLILCGWEARVRAVASLAAPASAPPGGAEAVTRAAKTLHGHLDALIALQPGWMARALPLAPGRRGQPAVISEEIVARYGDAEIVRVGVDSITVMTQLCGVDAGEEILRLHFRARSILGETRPQRETFDGIPCRECEDMALERAEPPPDPSMEEMHSRCAACGAEMSRVEFGEWAGRYAVWARGSALTCRRCQQGRHGECSWPACACPDTAHMAA